MDYDAIVLGSGNAGQAAAGALVLGGLRVALVESWDVGGTCALRGCVPKKVLVAAAETLDAIARAGTHCIDVARPALDWGALIDRELSFVEGVPADVERGLARRGVDVVHGRARFTARDRIDVDGRSLRAKSFVVAVGSMPRPLPFDGAEHLVTSADFLRMRELPKTAAFVGAGVIAFEFAHVLARAGTRVTMLEVADRALGNMDGDVVSRLVARTQALGVEIQTGVRLSSVAEGDGRYTISYTTGNGEERELEVDRAIHGAGRVAALSELELGAAGVELDRGRPVLDEHLRSKTNAAIHFAGDARGPGPQLSPVASYEGQIAAHNILEPQSLRAPDYLCVPSCVFTIPTLASVGRTEAAARAAGIELDVRENDMRTWRSARTYGEDEAYSKILVEQSTGRLVGAHLLGHGAAETIHAFALAMRHGLPASALGEMVYAYPTFHADLRYQL